MTGSSREFYGTGTNFSDTGTGTFFRDQFFPIPVPVLFSGTNFFRYRYRYFFPGPIFSGTGTIQKGAKFPGPVTLCYLLKPSGSVRSTHVGNFTNLRNIVCLVLPSSQPKIFCNGIFLTNLDLKNRVIIQCHLKPLVLVSKVNIGRCWAMWSARGRILNCPSLGIF